MPKIKREAFDALPIERKTRVTSTPVLKTTFAELPKTISISKPMVAMILHLGNATLEIHNGADATTIEQTLRILKELC